jgi:hypothetical protein
VSNPDRPSTTKSQQHFPRKCSDKGLLPPPQTKPKTNKSWCRVQVDPAPPLWFAVTMVQRQQCCWTGVSPCWPKARNHLGPWMHQRTVLCCRWNSKQQADVFGFSLVALIGQVIPVHCDVYTKGGVHKSGRNEKTEQVKEGQR